MLRLIFSLCVLVALTWSVVWVTDNPGHVSLNWGGWHIQTSAGVMVGAVAILTVLVALVYRFWLFLTRVPGRIGGALKERRSQKGYKALTKGMVAVAAGDAEEAQSQVKKADGLLGEPPLTLLLKAQAAQLNGDEGAAETFFKTMLKDPEMEFLGLRGLLNQAMKRGDDVKALELARRAQGLKPKSEWMADALFELEAKNGHWLEANAALTQADKLKATPKTQSQHRQAVTLLGQSLNAEKSSNMRDALKLAQKAVSNDPNFTPAVLRLAQLYVRDGSERKARNVIEKVWAIAPHPDFIAVYFEASKAKDALKKVAASEKLLLLNPSSPDANIAIAMATLDAKIWGKARTHLQAALNQGRYTRTVCTLMARLEGEDRGDEKQMREWLTKAASAAADPAWVCEKCGHVESNWTPHCPKCQSFDALGWQTPQGYEALALAQDDDVVKIAAPQV